MKATASNAIYKITVIAVSIVLCTGCEGKQKNKIPVYETNQYQTYRRLLNLCANSIEKENSPWQKTGKSCAMKQKIFSWLW